MQKNPYKIIVIVPCYKRPEYTYHCIKALEEAQEYENVKFYLYDDASNDGTKEILEKSTLPKEVIVNESNLGLRHNIIHFLNNIEDCDYIAKVDNDCVVPKNWLNDLLKYFEEYEELDIISPNVMPSDPASKTGEVVEGKRYLKTEVIGGLWFMPKSLADGMFFEQHELSGLIGAIPLLRQIIDVNDATVAWTPDIVFQDIGHWSGEHPNNIKTDEHRDYYREVGRNVAW